MSDVVLAVVTGVSGAVGACVGGGATFLAQRAERRDRDRGELRVALSTCLHALDMLHVEVQHLPPVDDRSRRLSGAIARRLPLLDWSAGMVGRYTLGRPVMRALGQTSAAVNRLALVAPEPVLEQLVAIHELMARIEQRDAGWEADWARVRGELQRAGMAALGS